jgi:hypothetical protein
MAYVAYSGGGGTQLYEVVSVGDLLVGVGGICARNKNRHQEHGHGKEKSGAPGIGRIAPKAFHASSLSCSHKTAPGDPDP